MTVERRPWARTAAWALCGVGAGLVVGFLLGLARPRPYAQSESYAHNDAPGAREGVDR